MKRLILSKSLTPVFLLILISCSPVVKNPTSLDFHTIKTNFPPEQEYKIQIGDQLDVKFFYNPELNEQVTVRPDGRISLQLVHEIIATGLTASELTDFLTKKYAPELKKPEITVIVRSFGAYKIRGVAVVPGKAFCHDDGGESLLLNGKGQGSICLPPDS
jgi:polysaccharide export outer membrane protein